MNLFPNPLLHLRRARRFKMTIVLSTISAAAFAAAQENPGAPATDTEPVAQPPSSETASDPPNQPPAPEGATTEECVPPAQPVPFDPAAYREFGFDFLRTLAGAKGYATSEDKNVFLSPLSLGVVLEALWYGTAGDTAREIAEAMHHPSPEMSPEVDETTGAVCRRNGSLDGGEDLTLQIANAVWLNDGKTIKKPFANTLKVRFRSDQGTCDFGRSDQAAEEINKWIARETGGNIRDLVGPGDFNENTLLAITNAVYFKGNWLTRFDPKKTAEKEFTLTSGRKVKVPVMSMKAPFALVEKDGLQVIEMPYAGRKASMFLLLPKEGEGELEKLEKALNDKFFGELETLCEAAGQATSKEVEIMLPKFTVTDTPDTVAVLQAMGIKKAFDEAAADFSRMSDEAGLYLAAFKHQARIEVNEAGSEAAAATAAAVGVRSVNMLQPRFIATRPFLYLIRDNATGTVLFLGRMANPDRLPEPPAPTTARPTA